jgi:hypothetical protein
METLNGQQLRCLRHHGVRETTYCLSNNTTISRALLIQVGLIYLGYSQPLRLNNTYNLYRCTLLIKPINFFFSLRCVVSYG